MPQSTCLFRNKTPILSNFCTTVLLFLSINVYMNYNSLLVKVFILVCLFSFYACEEICDSALNEEVGDEYFTVEYRSPAGDNYLEGIYNTSNVVVYMDPSGGENPVPDLQLIKPGYENGKFGPFRFTENFIDPATQNVNTVQLYGRVQKYDYFIKKDTYGQDTISLSFLMEVDECNNFWRFIRYSINGIPQVQLDLDQQAEIVIVE